MTVAVPVQPQERLWQVNGLDIRGLSWGHESGTPLLCLHGWLDNATSFSMLAPRLPGCHVVALDLTGHGSSAWRSTDATYQIWDDLPEIKGVVDALGWGQFNLVGHSRGAMISTLFASSMPERIRRLVLLDAITPRPVTEAEFSEQLARFLADKQRLAGSVSRVFPAIDDAVRLRIATGLTAEAAALLVRRNLQPRDGGYTWSTDPRLRGASAAKLTEGQIQAVLQGLSMPALLLVAEAGYRDHSDLETARRHAPDIRVETVPGGHHFHMEPGVDVIAGRIARFLE